MDGASCARCWIGEARRAYRITLWAASSLAPHKIEDEEVDAGKAAARTGSFVCQMRPACMGVECRGRFATGVPCGVAAINERSSLSRKAKRYS